ncbi:glycosyl transferase [Delphinella strobiligena]|nr:glycosyl transferase [Delphinella strobiligena]
MPLSRSDGAICGEHGFSLFDRPRKVYDLVLFSTELDWLEIRLHTHAPYVDYFVVVESPTTFSNKPKPLHLKENWERYEDFHHQIIYRVVEDPIVSARAWDHEDYLRNALLYEVFPALAESPQAAQQNDVLIVSDMDELIKPGALLLLRHCDFPKRLTLRTYFYYYSFQWLHRGEQWAHPQASTFGASIDSTLAPNDLRMNLLGRGFLPLAALSRWWDSATLWNAGWHCSSCFSTIREMQTKLHSFSHQGWNTEENRDARTMVDRVRNGLDLFARPGEVYDLIEGNRDVPQYILTAFEREGRFGYLIDRTDDDAGFEDWVAPSL